MRHPVLKLPGLQLRQRVGLTEGGVVVRGIRDGRELDVELRHERVRTAQDDAALRFFGARARFARVRDSGLPAFVSIGERGGTLFAITSAPVGASLLDRRGELPLAERRTLRIARLIARALAALHERGLTHGALAPSRVLLNQRYSPTLVYYDVDPQPGAAGGPPSEEQAIAARLRFVAPERYGLIDAPVDGRADLYSLGALLYLCATGRAPFELDDDADILTHHATVPPEDPRAHNPELSPALAAIILRLLAKQPRRRYADVDALLSDLDRIPQLSDRAARGEPLALNTEGAPRSILDSGAFVGKEDEVRQLALHWQSARAGHGRAVHVQGPVGGGKSALVAGFVRRELDAARLVLEARCREPDARPLAPIRALLERYVRETITAEDDRRALALGFLDAAAAEAGAFLGRLSPFLAEVLGGRAALPDADVTPEQFHQTIALLLRLLVVRHEGAVLVLEDIEWLDPSSREVLRFLAPLLPTLPLLIVTTGGDGEAGREAVERISRESAVRYAGRVSVRPLSRSEVRALVSHSLGDAALEQPVIDALARSSRGSPAAVLDCVREVADAGRLSMSRGRWCADKSTLALLARAVSRDDTVSAALSRLDPRERVVLGAAAVIGARFPAALLIEVTQRDKDEIRDVIARARARAILAREGHDVYVFRGEALRRRLADELPAAARDEVHERVAVALEEELEEEREEEREEQRAEDRAGDEDGARLEIARHYLACETPREPARAYAAVARAVVEATRTFADVQALALFERARALQRRYELTADPAVHDSITLAYGRAEPQRARLERALEFTADALAGAPAPTQAAALKRLRGDVQLRLGQHGDAIATLTNACADINSPLPGTRLLRRLWALWMILSVLVRDLLRPASARAQGEQESTALELRYALDQTLIDAGAATGDRVLRRLGLVRLVASARRLGTSYQLARAYNQLSVALDGRGRPRLAFVYLRRALSVARALKDPVSVADSLFHEARFLLARGELGKAEVLATMCLERYGVWLKRHQYRAAWRPLLWNLIVRGHFERAAHWFSMGAVRIGAATIDGVELESAEEYAYAAMATLSQERYDESELLLRRGAALVEGEADDAPARLVLLGVQALHHAHSGQLGDELEPVLAALERGLSRLEHRSQFTRVAAIGLAYARYERCLAPALPGARDPVPALRRARGLLWSAATSPALEAHAELIDAALLCLRGRPRVAARQLTVAERVALDSDSRWVLIEAARLRGVLLRAERRPEAAAGYVVMARRYAREAGWGHRAGALLEELAEGARAPRRPAPVLTRVGGGEEAKLLQRKLDALLEISLGAVSQQGPDEIARGVLDAAIRILGAERGFVFLASDVTGALEFLAGRSARLEELDGAEAYSATVVERVREERRAVVVTDTEDGAELGAQSVVVHNLRSIVAAPLQMHDKLVGVIYLDSRALAGAFGDDDVELLQAIAGNLAIAHETARSAERLRIARDQALASNHAKSTFLSVMSHELRTPLNIITGYTEMLLEDRADEDDPELLESLKRIRQSSGELLALVSNVLALSQAEASELALEEFELTAMLEELADRFLPAIRRGRSRLVRRWPVGLGTMRSDPDRVRKILSNILSNAAKFTQEGEVTLRAELDGRGATPAVVFTVRDTGPGISKEVLGSIFLPFQQRQMSSTRDVDGAGIGLAASLRMAETLGGFITAESEIGAGSTFTVRLPLRVGEG